MEGGEFMSVTKEITTEILGFYLGKKKSGEIRRSEDFGEVEQGKRLVYRIFPYQERAVALEGQPLVLSWTRQPVLALVNGNRATTLAYAADVNALGEGLAARIADRLQVIKKSPV